MRRRRARKSGWLPAATYALALHGAIIALLVIGFRFVTPDDVPAPVMQAVVVREPPPDPQQLQQQAQEQERKRAEAEAERQRQEAERKKQEQTEQRRQEEEKKKQDQELRKKEEAERKKQEQAEKRKQDEERKKADKERQQQAESALRDQLAEEERNTATARARRLAPQFDKYKTAIRQKVERNWVRPPSSRKGQQCTVQVRQAVGGEVLEAKAVCPSGDPAFTRSVEAAVSKASPLPTPENPELFDRDIEFIFRPED